MIENRTQSLSFFKTIFPWLMVLCGILFYCFNFFLRVSPSVMQQELTQAFHISATQFGTLAAFYYWAYTLMQIPAGLLYDKFGVRFVLSMACILCTLGLSLFISSDNYLMAGCGRFLIGIGCAFAFMGTLKLGAVWLPANRFGTVACTTSAIGICAGALSQRYLASTVAAVGYQRALGSALFAGIALSIFFILFVRSQPRKNASLLASQHKPMDLKELLDALRYIFTNRQMWLIGIISGLSYLPSSVFLDLWGIPYLTNVYGLTRPQAVTISSYTFAAGWILAGPLIGMFSDRICRRRLPLIATVSLAALLLCVVFYVPGLSIASLNIIFFIIGFCCGSHPLCFALGKENIPIQFSATAVAVTNMITMAGGAIFQPVVGKLLDWHASGATNADGLLIYTASDYTFALSVVPLGVALSIFLSFFLKETYCQTIYAIDEDKKAKEKTEGILEEG